MLTNPGRVYARFDALWLPLRVSQVKKENPKEKNVDILEEAYRAVVLLGGGATVFCKSGKDRTAMSITLHQSKALGEHF